MILRPYQDKLVSKAVSALEANGNTLAVAATGAGKTIMLADLARRIGGKTLILQHREELINQNESKFRLINPKSFTSFVKANDKNYSGDAVFAMVQTLSRNGNLSKLPVFDHLIIDEAHHSSAISFLNIIEKIRTDNPYAFLTGFTATPCRADGHGLRRAGFDNCCAEISTSELVNLGFLVPPVAYTHNLAGVSFDGIKKTASGELDMDAVAEVMDIEIHNETVVQKWKELAGDRKTVVFCSTIKHAESVCGVFIYHGINAKVITGETPLTQRADMLKSLADGDLQVVCNVAVLTEGWDEPKVSCVILLRPCSAKSTMIQMIGRGLRIDDGKDNCIVLDFGMSLATHRDLLTSGKKALDDRMKDCPSCGSSVPPGVSECPICGFIWEKQESSDKEDKEDSESKVITDIEMICLNILEQSPFLWSDLFKTDTLLVATGFESQAFVISIDDGKSYIAIGKQSKHKLKVLNKGNKPSCLSVADDFLRASEISDAAQKSKRWLNDWATQKQRDRLQEFGYHNISLSKYEAACHLSFKWNQKQIERILKVNG